MYPSKFVRFWSGSEKFSLKSLRLLHLLSFESFLCCTFKKFHHGQFLWEEQKHSFQIKREATLFFLSHKYDILTVIPRNIISIKPLFPGSKWRTRISRAEGRASPIFCTRTATGHSDKRQKRSTGRKGGQGLQGNPRDPWCYWRQGEYSAKYMRSTVKIKPPPPTCQITLFLD